LLIENLVTITPPGKSYN